jgi:cyanophycin synthetase
MGGEVIVAINRIPPFVIGNGKQTIAELIDTENISNPLRGNDYEKPLSFIRVDSELDHCIKQYGYSRNSIPPRRQKVILRSNSNLGTGATAREVTQMMNAETKEICIRTCRELGLQIA